LKSGNDAGAFVPLAVDRIGLSPQISYVAAAIINVGQGCNNNHTNSRQKILLQNNFVSRISH